MKNYIKKFRAAMALSQSDLASLVGVARETICRVEANKANPSLELAYRIASALHVTIDELFEPEENKILQ